MASSYKELSLKFGLKQLLLKVQHGLACFVVMQHKALHMYKNGQMQVRSIPQHDLMYKTLLCTSVIESCNIQYYKRMQCCINMSVMTNIWFPSVYVRVKTHVVLNLDIQIFRPFLWTNRFVCMIKLIIRCYAMENNIRNN